MEDKNIEKWANSFSGCDGGDINSDVWLCGIEWGYSDAKDEEREKYYEKELPTWIQKGAENIDTEYDFFKDTDENGKEYQFNLKFKKILKELNFSSKILKLNILPIPFNKDDDTLWTQNIVNASGFTTKNEYVKYIVSLHRFSKIRNEKKPNLIVCVGTSRKNEFLHTFFEKNNLKFKKEIIRPNIDANGQNNRYINYLKHDNTLLVVLPFLTYYRNCLNSDYLLKKAGSKIMELLDEK